jgi:hypothetical protein
MDAEVLAERLKATAEAVGLEVRSGPPDSEGAVVRLRERRIVFVPAGAPAQKRLDIIAGALAAYDLEDVYLVPAAREAVERARRRGAL